MQDLVNRAFEWGKKRGIHDTGTLNSQLVKLMEEVGELAAGVARNDHGKIIDAVGDVLVVLVQFGAIHTMTASYLADCLESALDVIEKRTGKTEGGIFVRDDE